MTKKPPTKNKKKRSPKKSVKSKSRSWLPGKRFKLARPLPIALMSLLVIGGLYFVTRSHAGTLIQSDEDVQAVLINSNRHSNLFRANCLTGLARQWARTMGDQNRLYHSPDLAAKVSFACGGGWQRIGENVGYGGSSVIVFNGFMNSPPHRANILGDFSHVGIGAYRSNNGTLWIVQMFAKCPGCGGRWAQPSNRMDVIGVHRRNSFYLRGTHSSGPADIAFGYGNEDDKPLMCDWDRNGSRTPGVFRKGIFYLRNANSAGGANQAFAFGNRYDTPICGDWDGNGFESVGVHRGNMFYLRNNNSSGGAEIAFPYGNSGDVPLACDWDGNGFTSVGVYRKGWFYLRNSNTAGRADLAFPYGNIGDKPICGDWDGNGTDTIGVFRKGVFYLRNSNSPGAANLAFGFGNSTDKPLVWH